MAEDTNTVGTNDEGETTDLAWYERYSWLVFVVIGLSGLFPALQLLVDPSSGTTFFAGFGHPVPESILSDPTEVRFLEFVFRWIGTVLLGSNLLTIFIAVTAWRKGAAWAWVALWYWPFMFTSHYIIYDGGLLKNLQIVWVAVTVMVLVSNFRRFFPRAEGEVL